VAKKAGIAEGLVLKDNMELQTPRTMHQTVPKTKVVTVTARVFSLSLSESEFKE
jgi:hypothetical protein